MAKDKDAWNPKDPNYKAGEKLGKGQKAVEDQNTKNQGKGGKK